MLKKCFVVAVVGVTAAFGTAGAANAAGLLGGGADAGAQPLDSITGASNDWVPMQPGDMDMMGGMWDDHGYAFGQGPIILPQGQRGVLNANAPIVDGRCAAVWYGSAVLGGSTPVGTQNIVCDDVRAPIKQIRHGESGGLLF